MLVYLLYMFPASFPQTFLFSVNNDLDVLAIVLWSLLGVIVFVAILAITILCRNKGRDKQTKYSEGKKKGPASDFETLKPYVVGCWVFVFHDCCGCRLRVCLVDRKTH